MRAFIALGLAAALASTTAVAQSGGVAARINGVALPTKEVDRLVAKMVAGSGMSAAEFWNDALDQLVTLEVLQQAAQAEGLRVTTAEVDQEIKDLKAQTAANPQLAKAFEGVEEAETRRDLQRSLLIEKLVQKHVVVNIPKAEIEKYYEANKSRFQRPEMLRASHILIKIQDKNPDAARKRAEEILQRLKKGEDFAQVAKTVSQDAATAPKGGDLGFFPRRPTPVAEAAFGLKPGQISGLVESPYGFHIVKVTETRASGLAPLGEVAEDIKSMLEDEQREEKEDAFVESLKNKAKIEILESKPESPRGKPVAPAAGAAPAAP